MMVADGGTAHAVTGTPAQPFLEEHNSQMFDSIRSVTSSAVGPLEYIARQKGTGFSVRTGSPMSPGGVLFMPYSAGQIAALRSTISAWMRLAIFEAMEPRSRRPTSRPELSAGFGSWWMSSMRSDRSMD